MSRTADYVLGHSDFEIERLRIKLLSSRRYHPPINSRMQYPVGHEGPGYRLWSRRCVSMLLAEAVGPSGLVVAIDREARAVETARSRAKAAGHRNIEALVATDDDIRLPTVRCRGGPLCTSSSCDPAAMIRRAGAAVRPGGVVAFHEFAGYPPNRFQAIPRVALYDQVAAAMNTAFDAALPSPDVAGRLVASLCGAGLPSTLFCECVIGDSTSLVARWLALTYRGMLPHIARLGLEPTSVGDPETLVERLGAEADGCPRASLYSNPQICGWAVRPLIP